MAQTASKSATLAAPFPGDEYNGDLDGICSVPCEEGDMSITLSAGFSGTVKWSFSILPYKIGRANAKILAPWQNDPTETSRQAANGTDTFNVMPGQTVKITPADQKPVGTADKLSGTARYSAPRGSASFAGEVDAKTSTTIGGTLSTSTTPYAITIKPHL